MALSQHSQVSLWPLQIKPWRCKWEIGTACTSWNSDSSVCFQKVLCAEMCPLPPWHLRLWDGHARPRLCLSSELLHLLHLQQDLDYRRPFRHEGQPGVLPCTLRDPLARGVSTSTELHGVGSQERRLGFALLQWHWHGAEGEAPEAEEPSSGSGHRELQLRWALNLTHPDSSDLRVLEEDLAEPVRFRIPGPSGQDSALPNMTLLSPQTPLSLRKRKERSKEDGRGERMGYWACEEKKFITMGLKWLPPNRQSQILVAH